MPTKRPQLVQALVALLTTLLVLLAAGATSASAFPPTVIIVNPATGSGLTTPPLTLEFQVFDGQPPYEITCQVDSRPAISPCVSGMTVQYLPDGLHTFTASAEDSNGDVAGATVVFSTDFPDPPDPNPRSPVPSSLGYAFANVGTSGGSPSFSSSVNLSRDEVLTEQLLEAAFSNFPINWYSSTATQERRALWAASFGGTCFGLALTGARFFSGFDSLQSSFDGRTSALWNVPSTRSLQSPASGQATDIANGTPRLSAFGTESVRQFLGAFIGQFSFNVQQVIGSEKRSLSNSASNEYTLRSMLTSAMNNGAVAGHGPLAAPPSSTAQIWMIQEMGLSQLGNPTGRGHAVVAYDVRDIPSGGFFIDVWDNNDPTGPHSIRVYPNGSWEYDRGGWSGSPKGSKGSREFVLVAPNFQPRQLAYMKSTSPELNALASVNASVTSVVATDGAAEGDEVVPAITGSDNFDGGTVAFESPSGELELVGTDPSVSIRGDDTVLAVEPAIASVSGISEPQSSASLSVDFSTTENEIGATGEFENLSALREGGVTILASGASRLAAPTGGNVVVTSSGVAPLKVFAESADGATHLLASATSAAGSMTVITPAAIEDALAPEPTGSTGAPNQPSAGGSPPTAGRADIDPVLTSPRTGKLSRGKLRVTLLMTFAIPAGESGDVCNGKLTLTARLGKPKKKINARGNLTSRGQRCSSSVTVALPRSARGRQKFTLRFRGNDRLNAFDVTRYVRIR